MAADRKNPATKNPVTKNTVAEDRLRHARIQVENVLWNFEHCPENPALRDPDAWRRIFESLRDTLG